MSLWWVQKEQLDQHQIALIERLPLRERFLILGPPGSGKTNVLLRRAQFARGQNMPNILVLTFTRPLTEFVKTGCYDGQGREIFPPSCVTTLESWQRGLYEQHDEPLPPNAGRNRLTEWKRRLAVGAQGFCEQKRLPPYDALFIDEAQDLLPEEVDLLTKWSPVLFFVGDDRQRIYENGDGLAAVRTIVPEKNRHSLPFHYRMAPEICEVADRILLPTGGDTLASTQHYNGPTPARVTIPRQPLSKRHQLEKMVQKLKEQVRVYGDLIREGDRLGVIVARREDRDAVLAALAADPALNGKAKIIRARDENDDDYDPSFESAVPICILTVQGCKGLEFRAVHWLFADELSRRHNAEHYYTVITRAKTSIDILHTRTLPQILACAHTEGGMTPW